MREPDWDDDLDEDEGEDEEQIALRALAVFNDVDGEDEVAQATREVLLALAAAALELKERREAGERRAEEAEEAERRRERERPVRAAERARQDAEWEAAERRRERERPMRGATAPRQAATGLAASVRVVPGGPSGDRARTEKPPRELAERRARAVPCAPGHDQAERQARDARRSATQRSSDDDSRRRAGVRLPRHGEPSAYAPGAPPRVRPADPKPPPPRSIEPRDRRPPGEEQKGLFRDHAEGHGALRSVALDPETPSRARASSQQAVREAKSTLHRPALEMGAHTTTTGQGEPPAPSTAGAGSLQPGPEPPDGLPVLTGADLARWRARLGLTQQAAADRLGVRQGTVSKAESRGSAVLGSALHAALAVWLGRAT